VAPGTGTSEQNSATGRSESGIRFIKEPDRHSPTASIFTLCKYTAMRYTWNEKKNRRNRELHGITFEDAIRIFESPTFEVSDDRFSYGEDRVYAIGLVNGLEITVIYADGEKNERRIISAWRSEPSERRRYWQNIEA
jgi:uncharacterized DUF497 family protein